MRLLAVCLLLAVQTIFVNCEVPLEWEEWSQASQRHLLWGKASTGPGPGPAPKPPEVCSPPNWQPFKELGGFSFEEFGSIEVFGFLQVAVTVANSISRSQPTVSIVLHSSLVSLWTTAAAASAKSPAVGVQSYTLASALLAPGPVFGNVDYLDTLSKGCQGLSLSMSELVNVASLKDTTLQTTCLGKLEQSVTAMRSSISVAQSQDYVASVRKYSQATDQASNCVQSSKSGAVDASCYKSVSDRCSSPY